MSGKPIRKTQAIAPFGPGAIVDFPGPVSMIHSGLEAYPFDPTNIDHVQEFVIDDETRLSARLRVKYFVEPMEYRRPRRGIVQKNVNLHLPFLRFPLWHVCPRCGMMHKSEYHRKDAPKCTGPIGSGQGKGNPHPPRVCHQVRFVSVCEKGHISDLPWCEWISNDPSKPFEPIEGRKWLRMMASGSASASGITIRAEELVGGKIREVLPPKTLGSVLGGETATGLTPLGVAGITCTGTNPVLGIGSKIRPSPGCGQQLYVLLKNATNLYFPNVKASIFIPSISDASTSDEILDATQNAGFCNYLFDQMQNSDDGLLSIKQGKRALSRYYKHLVNDQNVEELVKITNTKLIRRFLELNEDTNTYLSQAKQLGSLGIEDYRLCCEKLGWDVDPQLFLERNLSEPDEFVVPSFVSEIDKDEYEEEVYRLEEYKVFTKEVQAGSPKVDLDVRIMDSSSYPTWMSEKIPKVSKLDKLRETRAFTGFNRLFSHGTTPAEQEQLFISDRNREWLPAVIVRGEGIFFEFSEDSLDYWYDQNRSFLEERENKLTGGLARYKNVSKEAIQKVSAKKVLLHTFAHILMNELIFDCGYGSASLRERMYFSERTSQKMYAVLIYTAAGDSEGSMGGLVQQAYPNRLPKLIENAVLKASWCSSDPVCIESNGQGPAGLNLGACHSCALMPETSCEMMNLQLDRAMLIGTPTQPDVGYFSDLLTGRKP